MLFKDIRKAKDALDDAFYNVKTHIEENKTVYIAAASSIATGALVAMIVRTKPVTVVTNIAPVISPIFNNDNSSNVVNFAGHAHKIVRGNANGQIWGTVTEAAEAAGVELSRMSRHLNGHIPHIDGETYSIIGMGTAS